VENPSPEERIVLLIRFWHPDLRTPQARTAALQQAMEEKERAHEDRWVPPLDLDNNNNRLISKHLPIKDPAEDTGYVQKERCRAYGGRCQFQVVLDKKKKELGIECACGETRVDRGELAVGRCDAELRRVLAKPEKDRTEYEVQFAGGMHKDMRKAIASAKRTTVDVSAGGEATIAINV
jgi:hypothetical protein